MGAALSAIRANVYLNAILTRDYLLDTDPSHIEQYVSQFEQIREKTQTSLRALETSGPDEQRRRALQHLRVELDAYWDPTELALDWTPEEKRARGAGMLRQRLRKREEVFALAGQVEQLADANFQRERQRITSADLEFRRSLTWTTAIMLLFGLGIAGAALGRMLALEKKSEFAASELRLLSGTVAHGAGAGAEISFARAARPGRPDAHRAAHGVGRDGTPARGRGKRALACISPALKRRWSRRCGLSAISPCCCGPRCWTILGLTPALAWLVKEMSAVERNRHPDRKWIRVDSLPDAHRTCVYRVVQEALTNAAAHSGARKRRGDARSSSKDGWSADYGRRTGFDTRRKSAKGLGLLGMEERVRELGGSIRDGVFARPRDEGGIPSAPPGRYGGFG